MREEMTSQASRSGRCDEESPDSPEIRCSKTPHPYGTHVHRESGATWSGLPIPDFYQRRTAAASESRLVKVALSVRDAGAGSRTGPPHVSGPPRAVLVDWASRSPVWIAEAKRALRQVCEAHERFTNAVLWPLLDAPQEKRTMVVVTRHGLSCGWMVEDGAVRERGEWTTRDGVTFALNKLTPVYHSLIFRGDTT